MSVADAPESIPLTARIIVPGAICRDFERSSRLEWLDTNHTGAFAMGTVAGVNTRRYHGLLTASLKPPANRLSILPRLEELVSIEGVEYALGVVQYPGTIHPRGFELLEEFRFAPFPQWSYRCGSACVTKTVCLIDRQQSVLVGYRSTRPCTLSARLLTSFRDYHSLAHENGSLRNEPEMMAGCVSFMPYPDLPPLRVFHGGRFQPQGEWFLRHQYLRELDRGLDFEEDLFSLGKIEFQLAANEDVWILATVESQCSALEKDEIHAVLEMERKRRQFDRPTLLESTLARALDQFTICRYDGNPSLIAGYPWFTDWSRDILISLPALSVAGFPGVATKKILHTLIDQRSDGLLPNRFLDNDAQPEYNTADATLWLFAAGKAYIDQSQDMEYLSASLYPAARDIIAWHRRGTRYGIHVDPQDHLLWAGTNNTQLTWMDARVHGSAVTPRAGKPVEINALWYNALQISAEWAVKLNLKAEAEKLQLEAAATLASFRKFFWNEERTCLFDVLGSQSRDSAVRPNQIFALSLPYPLVDRYFARLILQVVRENLLTPVGLRTLEPGDPAYRPRFEGPMEERDAAYHQGTVWPWLLGPFIQAYVYAYEDEAIEFCRDLVNQLGPQLLACCLGSLAEVYDGNAPQRPGGCPAQLWSVAQLLLATARLRILEYS